MKITKEEMQERMTTGKLYKASELPDENKRRDLIDAFNHAPRSEAGTRTEQYLKPVFMKMGKNCYIEPPVFLDHGFNISVGDQFYANTDCIFLDQCPIVFGDRVLIGPRVNFYCATHPVDAYVRSLEVEGGKPITVGSDVWIGGSTTFCPGVTVGNNVIIGAGSVVVKDIPSDSIAVGNPCRVVRKITENDHEYWMHELQKFEEETGIYLH